MANGAKKDDSERGPRGTIGTIAPRDQFRELVHVFRRRDGSKWSMAELAKATGVDKSTLSKLMSGSSTNPTWNVMWKIAKVMEFDPSMWMVSPDQWPSEVQKIRVSRPSQIQLRTHAEQASHHLGLATGKPDDARMLVKGAVGMSRRA